jgi:hypothetical protein
MTSGAAKALVPVPGEAACGRAIASLTDHREIRLRHEVAENACAKSGIVIVGSARAGCPDRGLESLGRLRPGTVILRALKG